MADAADGLLDELSGTIGDASRIALFGHSLGAVLAYELAHRIQQESKTELVHLFVSGSPVPWAPRAHRATGLPDSQFLARVQEFAGYRPAVLEDPELRELILPTLRIDVEMHENYRADSVQPVAVPITALRGLDDELVTAAETAAWSRATTADFRAFDLPGGHMHLIDNQAALVRLISRAVC